MKISNKKIIYYSILIIISATFVVLLWRGCAQNNPGTSQEKRVNTPTVNSPNSSKLEDNTRIFFASNGKTTVYKIKKDDKWAVIWNDREGKLYDYVSNPVFSTDGSQLAYSAELNGQALVVINNIQEISAYDRAFGLVFSPDGQEIAFVSIKDDGTSLVISAVVNNNGSGAIENGQEGQTYQGIGFLETPSGDSVYIIWSPDGEHMAYLVEEDGQVFVVIDGQEGERYDDITDIHFDEDGQIVYTAEENDQETIVINDQIVSTENTSSQDDGDSDDGDSVISGSYDSYRYKKSTEKDINRSSDQLNYPACVGENCNF